MSLRPLLGLMTWTNAGCLTEKCMSKLNPSSFIHTSGSCCFFGVAVVAFLPFVDAKICLMLHFIIDVILITLSRWNCFGFGFKMLCFVLQWLQNV